MINEKIARGINNFKRKTVVDRHSIKYELKNHEH